VSHIASEWFEATCITLGETAVWKLCCYENPETIHCLSTQEAAVQEQKLMKMSHDFLELKQDYLLSERSAREVMIESGWEEVSSGTLND
jgi:hypothetical protein